LIALLFFVYDNQYILFLDIKPTFQFAKLEGDVLNLQITLNIMSSEQLHYEISLFQLPNATYLFARTT
jgi:hypothetical protein